MLHPIYRLSSDPGGRWTCKASKRRSWRPTLIVPRALCIFESVPCKGVKWHELDDFARLQARRLAPYLSSGANGAVRGGTLMLWLWDEVELQQILHEAGLGDLNLRRLVETLVLELPVNAGTCRMECEAGVDVLSVAAGAIVSSNWLPAKGRAAHAERPITQPWARERLQSSAKLGAAGANWSLSTAMRLAGLALLVGGGAYAAYWGGQLYGAEKLLREQETAASATQTLLQEAGPLRGAAAANASWVERYVAQSQSLELAGLLQALERPLESQGLVVKELEVKNGEARLALVSAGTDIDLPGTLQALDDVPGIDAVQLRQNSDPAQATFSFAVPGFRRSPFDPAFAEPTVR